MATVVGIQKPLPDLRVITGTDSEASQYYKEQRGSPGRRFTQRRPPVSRFPLL